LHKNKSKIIGVIKVTINPIGLKSGEFPAKSLLAGILRRRDRFDGRCVVSHAFPEFGDFAMTRAEARGRLSPTGCALILRR
jgi:hypothetical protein